MIHQSSTSTKAINQVIDCTTSGQDRALAIIEEGVNRGKLIICSGFDLNMQYGQVLAIAPYFNPAEFDPLSIMDESSAYAVADKAAISIRDAIIDKAVEHYLALGYQLLHAPKVSDSQ